MDWTQHLSQCFLETLSVDEAIIRNAERKLSAAADTPNFGLAVLRLIAEPSVDEQIRQCAAVNLKKHIQSRWSDFSIQNSEKGEIKTLIVPTILSATTEIQAQLCDALTVIGNHDFIRFWPNLLPDLRSRLEKEHAAIKSDVEVEIHFDHRKRRFYAYANIILSIVASLFKKFSYEFCSEPILLDLRYCLDQFAEILLKMFWHVHQVGIPIFFYLTIMELPEFSEDHDFEWKIAFTSILQIVSTDYSPLVHEMQATVCEILSLYLTKDEEVLEDDIELFLTAVWYSLRGATKTPSRQRFAVAAIRFFTLASTSIHHHVFAREGLQRFCRDNVTPNVMWTDEDQILFDDNPFDFIRRDMAGIQRRDYYTRLPRFQKDYNTRRACRELLRAFEKNYKDDITRIISEEISKCLALFHQNPNVNWKYKECAIYLVVSLSDVTDVESFFTSAVRQNCKGVVMISSGC